MPAEGYQGAYMIDLAKEIKKEENDKFLKMPESEGIAELGKLGLAKVLDRPNADLKETAGRLRRLVQ